MQNDDISKKKFEAFNHLKIYNEDILKFELEKNIKKNSIIIASYGTFSTGINIRNINNIVFASPSKSKIRVLQSIGRGLRISENKNSILVFDIADDISYNERRNFTLTHFTERINIYNEQQFAYEISRVSLR